jgi:hypothetical protein
MSERKPRASDPPSDPTDLESQVDAVADVLYGLSPEEFSSARDQFVKQARDQKNAALARELGKLRKPTQSAWLVNQLWREQHEVIEQLFELAGELSRAQAEASGPALRELTQQRRQLENALLQQAIGLARQKGVHVSDSTAREAQETLGAALALPEVADEVRTGRLVKPASYAGFGAPSSAAPARPPTRREPIDLTAIQRARAAQRETPVSEPEVETDAAARRAAEQEERRRREEEERRHAAERRLEDARAAAAMADLDFERASHRLATAEQRQDDLRRQLQTLREQVQRVESDVSSAEQAAAEAQRAREQALAAQRQAREHVREAEQQLGA